MKVRYVDLVKFGLALALFLSICGHHLQSEPLPMVMSEDRFPRFNVRHYQYLTIGENRDVAFWSSKHFEQDNPTIIFYAGFPDNCFSFDQQMEFFRQLEFNVVQVCQRGYFKASKPWKSFKIIDIAEDISTTLSFLKVTKAVHLVGHDWGSLVVQSFTKKYPGMVSTVSLLSISHMQPNFRDTISWQLLRQLFASWYMMFFQLPLISDYWINHYGVPYLWMKWDQDIHHNPQRLNAVWQTIKKHRTEARSYYWLPNIVDFFTNEFFKRRPKMLAPTLILHGSRDRCWLPDTVRLQTESRYFAKGHRLKEIEDGGHFFHHTKPDEVNKELNRWIMSSHEGRA